VLGLFVACGEETRAPLDASVEARTCPTHLDMELIGSESRFSPGSSGTAHGVGLAEGSRVTVEILSCDDECRRCTFHGPVRGDPAIEPVVTQRCLNGLATTCTTDDECETAASGSGPCRFIFPPISARIILPSCTLVYFDPIVADDPSPMQGTVDLQTGEADLPVFNLAISVSLQVVPGAPDAGCVECLGDTVPFDGDKGGTCQFGGQACDVNGIGTAVASTTSYDCAPPPNAFININLPANGTSTASRMWTMDGTRPSCTNAGLATGEPCWCGICSDGTPCIADSECADGSSCGAAGSTMDPINVKNNGCGNDVCNWDPIARSGTCSVSGASCFPDGVIGESMVAEGAAEMSQGFFIAQLANLVCMPELDGVSTGFGMDAIAGFPGPMLFEARFKVTPRGEQP
jgi:hypothetical protein